MNFVFDSSAMIYFGKLRILEKIAKLEGKKIVPKSVYSEVVETGLRRGEPEANYIQSFIQNKHFIVAKPKSQPGQIPFLSKADVEVLTIAKETNSLAIIDEIYSIGIAEAMGVENHGSVYLILKLLKEKIIGKEEAKNALNSMISLGFYLSVQKYNEVISKIEEL